MNQQNLESFINAYTVCMLWSSTDENGDPLDGLDLPLSMEAKRTIKADCESFFFAGAVLLLGLPDDYSYSDAGHDFWLTRNGHGAGFWDRGFGDWGDRMTDLSKTYGEQSPVVGDDGFIYL